MDNNNPLKVWEKAKASYTVHRSTLTLGNLCYLKKATKKKSNVTQEKGHPPQSHECEWEVSPGVCRHLHKNFQGLPGSPAHHHHHPTPGEEGGPRTCLPPPSSPQTQQSRPATRLRHGFGLAMGQLAPHPRLTLETNVWRQKGHMQLAGPLYRVSLF